MRKKLTPRQQRFVDEYLVDLNAQAAYMRAGCKREVIAKTNGPRLLKDPLVAAAVIAAKQRRQDRVEVKQDDVLRELMRLAYVDVTQIFDEQGRLKPPTELPEDLRRSIAGLDVEEHYGDAAPLDDGDGTPRPVVVGRATKVKFWDKVKALELLGKHLKLFTEKVEVGGNGGGPVGVVILPAEKD